MPGVTWQEMMEESPFGVATLGGDGTVSACNAMFLTLTGMEEDAGWKLQECVTAAEGEQVTAMIAAAAKGKKPAPAEVSLSSASALLTLAPLKGKKGGVVAYLLNTTQQKELEQRFVHSQKMQAVGQLAGGIAHDFNNLLTAMIGFCDLLLLRHAPGEQSFADIMQIKQNANRAANLVRQLLAFSRRQTLQPEVIDLTELLAELSHLLNRLLGESVTLQLQHGQDVWNIRADQGQLEQVIINLAVNARDAMKKNGDRGGVLTVRTRNTRVDNRFRLAASAISAQGEGNILPGDYVCIEVEDNGCGMNAEILAKIFEPFFTTKGVGEGTGLGLATVCGIIQQTGGYVFVQSIPGKGTQFSIFLKRHETEAAAARAVEKSEAVADLTGAGTVLLVEDEDPVRMFSARALENKGYTVLEADCGEAALEIIAEHDGAIDIVVTDVMMPGMTGPAMVKELKKNHPDLKVVFISGYGESAFLQEFGSERSFHFLPKPFSLSQLAGKVKEVLG